MKETEFKLLASSNMNEQNVQLYQSLESAHLLIVVLGRIESVNELIGHSHFDSFDLYFPIFVTLDAMFSNVG